MVLTGIDEDAADFAIVTHPAARLKRYIFLFHFGRGLVHKKALWIEVERAACILRKTGNEARKPGRSDRNANNRQSETGERQRYPRECRGFSHTGK
jgi:hypothetical protein